MKLILLLLPILLAVCLAGCKYEPQNVTAEVSALTSHFNSICRSCYLDGLKQGYADAMKDCTAKESK